MKTLLNFSCVLLILVCSQANAQTKQQPAERYRYNKVYDYENDTIKTKPFRTDSLTKFAGKFIGVPYVSPGQSPSGFDCSGFMFYCFRQYGIYLPYFAREQAELGIPVTTSNLKPGDLLFFQGQDLHDKSVHHVALVVSKKGKTVKFIHAASHGVRYETLDNTYYKARFLKSKRVY